MSIDVTTEKRFEADIEEFFLSPAGGYTHNNDVYDPQLGVYKDTLLRFIQRTQPKEWKRFLLQNKVDPERKFCLAFNNACDMDGLISVLRHGFKHRGIPFKVCYFKPESGLNQTAEALYEKNEITCNRQWFYSSDTHNSVDMVLSVNGIPIFALELKNQYTGQNVDNATDKYMMQQKIREHTTEESWKDFIINILINIPDVDMEIAEWVKEFSTIFVDVCKNCEYKISPDKEIKDTFKIKRNDNKSPDFKKISLKKFFEKKNEEKYTRSSIHGVKGESYEAVLLHVKSRTGSTITPKLLMEGELEQELMRLAYVAMTRPRRLLMLAMPDTKGIKTCGRFSEELWTYENL